MVAGTMCDLRWSGQCEVWFDRSGGGRACYYLRWKIEFVIGDKCVGRQMC